MRAPRITLGNVALVWMALFLVAALALPPLDSHARMNPLLEKFIWLVVISFLAITPVAILRYFKEEWSRAIAAPNKRSYVAWISLQMVGTAFCAALLMYALLQRG